MARGNKGGKKQGAPGASRGNISGNKGMGTSVSMVIPSSGYERRAGKRPSRASRSLPTHRSAPRHAASRRVAPRRAGTRRGSRNPSRAVFADRGTDTRTGAIREGCRRDETGDKLNFRRKKVA